MAGKHGANQARLRVLALILCIATAVLIYKHRMNYVRIYNGTEMSLRGGMKGKYRAE